MGVRIGIDSEGTFTDVMAVGEKGHIHTLKVPSTPEDPAQGFEEALRQMLETLDISPSQVDCVLHGTTVAINAILERRFPTIALITTKEFRDLLEIARDIRGIPILKPGELHQITNPNTSDRVTGWDIADYRGPLTWEQEEKRRAEVQKIHWHDNIEDLVVRYRPKPPEKEA